MILRSVPIGVRGSRSVTMLSWITFPWRVKQLVCFEYLCKKPNFFKPPLLICNWLMFSIPFLRCGPFCLIFAFWSFSLNNCFIMGFYFSIFNFLFVYTNLLVWLNLFLVNNTQFSCNSKDFILVYIFLYMTLFLTISNCIFIADQTLSNINIKIENTLQGFSCISFLFKPPC